MRALGIVVVDPGIRDVVELVPAKAHEVIETLPFDGADERFCEGIGLRCLDWTTESFGAVRAPEFPKSLGVFRVPVAQYESGFDALII